MNWYKTATKTAVSVTPAEFVAMTWREKRVLARNERISPETQRLFFTEPYEMKGEALVSLTRNPSITPATQLLFFTEEYEHKDQVLSYLARKIGIIPEVQRLFITQEYWGKYWTLRALTDNPSIHPEVQLLFFTEKYENKDGVLQDLVKNPSFLRDFTLKQLLQIKKVARGGAKLHVLSKRLEQIQKVAADIIRGKLKGGL